MLLGLRRSQLVLLPNADNRQVLSHKKARKREVKPENGLATTGFFCHVISKVLEFSFVDRKN